VLTVVPLALSSFHTAIMEPMETDVASPLTATGTYTALNELTGSNWRETLQGNGMDPAVLSLEYSPGNDLSSRVWNRSQYSVEKGIRPPEFEPKSFGCPLLWNSAESGTKYYGYRTVFGWGRNTKHWYPAKTDFMPQNRREFLFHFRDFLAIRPLSRDLDRFIPYWSRSAEAGEGGSSSGSAQQPRGGSLPTQVEGKGARSCADLFQWDSPTMFEHNYAKGNGKVEGFVLPYKPGVRILNGEPTEADKAAGWEVGYHACSA